MWVKCALVGLVCKNDELPRIKYKNNSLTNHKPLTLNLFPTKIIIICNYLSNHQLYYILLNILNETNFRGIQIFEKNTWLKHSSYWTNYKMLENRNFEEIPSHWVWSIPFSSKESKHCSFTVRKEITY